MSTSSARTERPQTQARILRRLRRYMAEQFAPPVCARIRATRERLKQEALEAGGREAAREFSQERVAQRVGLSLKAYRAYEAAREPQWARRREIARALGLDENYFEVGAEDQRVTRLAGEVEELRGLLERVLEARGESPEQARGRAAEGS